MPQDSQAQADLNEEPLVDDPLDASNDPDTGATELDNYMNDVSEMEMGEDAQEQSAESETESLAKEIAIDEDTPSDGEEQEPVVDDAEEETPSAETAEEAESPEGETEEPEAKTSERFRFKTDEDKAVAAIAKAKGISLVEASQEFTGSQTPAANTEEPEAETPTVASVSHQIKELRIKRGEASTELEFETAEEIQGEIDTLMDERDELRYTEREQQADWQVQLEGEFNEAFAASERKTVQFYPDTAKPGSELIKRMISFDERMLAAGDPVYDSPDKPFILAKAAAKELGIIMSNPNAKPEKVKKSSPKGSPIQPASGSARTSAPVPARKLDDALDGMESLEDYESLVEAI